MTMKISGGTGITYPDGSVATSAPANFVQENEPQADLVQPYMTWADTANMLLKRRNAANTAWVVLGPLFDYHYTRGNILGTVSQSGGVPTGAIIQAGTNANGTFVRFADGTQFCRHTMSFSLINGTTSIPWTFPAAFSAVPTALVQLVTSLPEVVRASPGTPSLGDLNIYGFSTFAGPASVAAFVMGRWY